MRMRAVESGAVRRVGYEAASRRMRVEFQDGGTYDYLDVDPDLYARMLQPHPWHAIGNDVRAHRFQRVA